MHCLLLHPQESEWSADQLRYLYRKAVRSFPLQHVAQTRQVPVVIRQVMRQSSSYELRGIVKRQRHHRNEQHTNGVAVVCVSLLSCTFRGAYVATCTLVPGLKCFAVFRVDDE